MIGSLLILIVSVLYIAAAIAWIISGNIGQALILIGYTVANAGLLMTLAGGN